MSAADILLGVSVAQLVAILFFGVQVGRGLGERDAALKDHGERLDELEPRVREVELTCAGNHQHTFN